MSHLTNDMPTELHNPEEQLSQTCQFRSGRSNYNIISASSTDTHCSTRFTTSAFPWSAEKSVSLVVALREALAV